MYRSFWIHVIICLSCLESTLQTFKIVVNVNLAGSIMTAGGNLAWAAANIGAPGIQFVLLNLSMQHMRKVAILTTCQFKGLWRLLETCIDSVKLLLIVSSVTWQGVQAWSRLIA